LRVEPELLAGASTQRRRNAHKQETPMPYATSDGVRIYYEREGSGPPLILHTGFGATLDLWRGCGYLAALRDEHELILMDPRGQGQSDKPHDRTAYTYDRRVADVLAVLDSAEVERAIFWGYSMGGRVAFAAAHYAPTRFRAFVAGGMHPEVPDRAIQDEEVAALSGGIPGYISLLERDGEPLPAEWRTTLLANDAAALRASASATAEAPDFTETLARVAAPMLVYVGELDTPFHDRAQRATAGLAQVIFVSLPGLDHGQAFGRSDLVLPHVRRFLADSAP
jgi:pimeloyl-ACP methyl ester carboxylesterase